MKERPVNSQYVRVSILPGPGTVYYNTATIHEGLPLRWGVGGMGEENVRGTDTELLFTISDTNHTYEKKKMVKDLVHNAEP
jgi:hypothetical protein